MTFFTQSEETENCNFGRIWKPNRPAEQKNEKTTPLKAGKKTKKSGQKRYPLKADFAVFIIFFTAEQEQPRRCGTEHRPTSPPNTKKIARKCRLSFYLFHLPQVKDLRKWELIRIILVFKYYRSIYYCIFCFFKWIILSYLFYLLVSVLSMIIFLFLYPSHNHLPRQDPPYLSDY